MELRHGVAIALFSLGGFAACNTQPVSALVDASPDVPSAIEGTFESGNDSAASDRSAEDAAEGGVDAAEDLDSTAEGGPCPPGMSLFYNAPGCPAQPVCLNNLMDACASEFCGCDGVTFTGACGVSSKPFASWGPCPDSGLDASGLD